VGRTPPEGGTPAGAPAPAAYRFLWCWVAVYLAFFSLSGTKLPNYILPVYPPLALLTARALDRWRTGTARPPAWAVKLSLICLALLGVGVGAGLFVASGWVPLRFLQGRSFPGLERCALAGLLPVLAGAWPLLRRQRRGELLAAVAASAVLFVGTLAAWGGSALNGRKAPKALAAAIHAHQTEPDIRIACYQYFQPSLVFYCRREVARLDKERQALDFLQCPLPAYLCLPAPVWESLRGKCPRAYPVIGRQRDLYRNCEIVVVANR
jgi:4-amino-4-deoxy-L-arabinose transferase-like glycosyltransferase